MRFSSSFVAFACVGLAAAAALPTIPSKPTSISASRFPEHTPDLSARDGVKSLGTAAADLPPLPKVTDTVGDIATGKGEKKGGSVARRKGSSGEKDSGTPVPSVSSLPSTPVVGASDNSVELGKNGGVQVRRKESSSGGKVPGAPEPTGASIPPLPTSPVVDASGNTVKGPKDGGIVGPRKESSGGKNPSGPKQSDVSLPTSLPSTGKLGGVTKGDAMDRRDELIPSTTFPDLQIPTSVPTSIP